MPRPSIPTSHRLPSRRGFLQTSTAALVGTGLAGNLSIARAAHAAGSDQLRVGLIGCGGRGTGAAAQALNADKQVKLTALGDVFPDRLEASLASLRKGFETSPERVAVRADHCFTGFDAFEKVLATDVDVVILATPPHFRPAHLKAAVAAGKHVFAEKPVAVDAPGVRSVLASVDEAKRRGLSLVSGLCYRYDAPKKEIISRIHDGAIGKVVAMHVSYNTGSLWMHPRKEEWSDMEWQLRNWLYFTWLSGDHNVEQHVHSLDKAAWVMRDEPPTKAIGMGGRQVRTGTEFGHIFDHHAVVYEYADGTRLFAFCRQQAGCAIDVSDYILGTKGTADLMRHTITGETEWRYRGAKPNMYQSEHDALFASIRSGVPINNGEYMTRSTMLAIMGRMVSYTGQSISWQDALNSSQDLTPAKYEFGPLPVAPVALPGITPFV